MISVVATDLRKRHDATMEALSKEQREMIEDYIERHLDEEASTRI